MDVIHLQFEFIFSSRLYLTESTSLFTLELYHIFVYGSSMYKSRREGSSFCFFNLFIWPADFIYPINPTTVALGLNILYGLIKFSGMCYRLRIYTDRNKIFTTKGNLLVDYSENNRIKVVITENKVW